MALYTEIPKTINNLVERLRVKATVDSQTTVVNTLDNIGTVSWFNILYKLNLLMSAVVIYQVFLLDGSVQDFIDDIGTIWFFDLFKKVNLLSEVTELIETL